MLYEFSIFNPNIILNKVGMNHDEICDGFVLY